MNTRELKEEGAKLLAQARSLVDHAERENRSMRDDENDQYDKIMASLDALEDRISKLEAVESKEDDQDQSEGKQTDDGGDEQEGDDESPQASRRSIWRQKGETRNVDPLSTPEYRSAFKQILRDGRVSPEYRDAILGTNSQGGYFALPTKLSQQFIIALDNLTFMRKLVTIEPVLDAKSLGVRQMTTQPSDASWSGEITQVTADSSMVVNQRALTPNILTKLVNISIQLALAAPDVESIVMDRIAYKFAVAQENAWLNGTGSGQPLGQFVASSNGIPTSQDVVSAASLANKFTGDDFISVVENIPQQYQNHPSTGWIMHRSVVSSVRKIKDSYGQYLLVAGLQGGQPDQFLGFPLYKSEYAPSIAGGATASQYVALFGRHSYYTYAEVVPPSIQVLRERYADLNEVGYLGRTFADGSCVLSAAFTRLQLAAS